MSRKLFDGFWKDCIKNAAYNAILLNSLALLMLIMQDINDVLSEQTLAGGRIYEKEQEIEEITRSCDPNDLIFETKNLLQDSTIVSYNDTREVDYLVSKGGAAHHCGLQTKGEFPSKVLQYLPLEIGFVCLVIALVSFVLWYLEVSPLIHS